MAFRRPVPAGGSSGATPRRRGPFQRGPARSGPRDGRKYVIGRAGTRADIEIDDPLVSVRHATLRVDGRGRWWIAGPIYVDGVKQMSATLSEGDVFVIGKTVVTVGDSQMGLRRWWQVLITGRSQIDTQPQKYLSSPIDPSATAGRSRSRINRRVTTCGNHSLGGTNDGTNTATNYSYALVRRSGRRGREFLRFNFQEFTSRRA